MNFKTKYIWLTALCFTFAACNDDDTPNEVDNQLPELTAGQADFSTYVAVGTSFSSGFTDNALFITAQLNSFPSILSQQFGLVGGGSFSQPLMNDNIGGFLVQGNVASSPRLIFNGTAPVILPATPTTEITTPVAGPFNNYGIPGIKSFHLGIPGYGSLNPYFGRMASSATATVIGDAVARNATFFTFSEIGGNDVLAYATSGGTGVDQTGNPNPLTYGSSDITDPTIFAQSYTTAIDALTANGAKGVVTSVPYITGLSHFTTVPFNPLSANDPAFGPQIPTLNMIYGALNQIFVGLNQPNRVITFSQSGNSALVIHDEDLPNISVQITTALNNSPTFPAFIAQFGVPAQASGLVAQLLGNMYGQSRQATAEDLFVLPSSSIIGKVNPQASTALQNQGLSKALADQFSVEGVTLPMADKWVLVASERDAFKSANDIYNQSIATVAQNKGLAFADLKSVLDQASSVGYGDGDFIFTTKLVTGGLVSLDGVHLTSRGYAAMANAILKAIDEKYGSNFEDSGNLVNVGNYPTNYSPLLR